jgi:hypothetical protein
MRRDNVPSGEECERVSLLYKWMHTSGLFYLMYNNGNGSLHNDYTSFGTVLCRKLHPCNPSFLSASEASVNSPRVCIHVCGV